MNEQLSFGLSFDVNDNKEENNYCLYITYENKVNIPSEYSFKNKIKYVLDQRCHNICVPCTILNQIIVNSNGHFMMNTTFVLIHKILKIIHKANVDIIKFGIDRFYVFIYCKFNFLIN